MGGVRRRGRRGALLALPLLVAPVACSGDDGDRDVAAFCIELAQAPPLDSVLAGYAAVDQHDLDTRLDDAAAAYADVREAAPSSIDAEVDDLVDLVDELVAAVRDHRDDPEAVAERLRRAVGDHPDAVASSRAVVEFAADRCDLDLDPTVADPAAPDDGTPGSTTTPASTTAPPTSAG